MAQQKTSDFYWACRNGDVNTVRKLISKLKTSEIDQIESNGSTALHAASYYGHTDVVRLLLEHDANTEIRNKYDKTAKEEASTDKIRNLFEHMDDDDELPQCGGFQLYRNADNMTKSALATRILKARVGTYQTHQYSISAASNIEHLKKKYRKLSEQGNNTYALEKGEELFKKFQETRNFDHILHLYTLETPFYRVVNDDNAFLLEMYKHLLRYDNYRVKCHLYRGRRVQPGELEFFQWALNHTSSLLETRGVLSTSLTRDIAQSYVLRDDSQNRARVLFQFDLTNKSCLTVVDIFTFSEYPCEQEVIILPGTFFSVTGIETIHDNITVVSLVNVPIDENVLLPTKSAHFLPGINFFTNFFSKFRH